MVGPTHNQEEEKIWLAMVWNTKGRRHVVCLVRAVNREQAERKALDAFQESEHEQAVAVDPQIYFDIMNKKDSQGNDREITYIIG